MNKITYFILMLIGSSITSTLVQSAEDPFARLVAVKEKVEHDEKIYREACYKAYGKGHHPPIRIPSPADFDEERWSQQCMQQLQKTHSKEIFKERMKFAINGAKIGAGLIGVSSGFLLCASDSLYEFRNAAAYALKLMIYFGTMGGGIAFAIGDMFAKNAVLEKELLKRKQLTQ